MTCSFSMTLKRIYQCLTTALYVVTCALCNLEKNMKDSQTSLGQGEKTMLALCKRGYTQESDCSENSIQTNSKPVFNQYLCWLFTVC